MLAIALSITGTAWWGSLQQARRLAEAQFTTVAKETATAIDGRMGDYEEVLRGTAGLVDAYGLVDRDGWRRYVDRLAVNSHYPGILGIGFAPRVTHDRRGDHEERVRHQGFLHYSIQPPGQRDEYYPVMFLDPFAGRNLRAFGYDMFWNPVRREAMERARDTGLSALTGKVTLVQETTQDVQAGVLLYLAVYRAGADLSTVEGRRESILGFVYSPFRMNDLMDGILGSKLKELRVTVYDGARSDNALLFGQNSAGSEATAGHHHYQARLAVFGRPWLLDIASTPSLDETIESQFPLAVLIGGIIISLLVTWLTHAVVAEQVRRLALAESNGKLAQSNANLLKARAEAEAANRAKSTFLAAASHDIRQPVQSMTYLLYVLSSRLAGHAAHGLVEALDSSLAALRLLLDSLLDVSKLDAGVVVPQITDTPLAPALQRLAQDYRLRAADSGLRLRVVDCSEWVRSDPVLLQRILANLLENALRYTHRGRILVGCRRAGNALRIEIWDTGIGIAPEHLESIFQEFHQIDNPERDRSKGLGLGLSIVRRLAHLLGHKVTVQSKVGSGSRFMVEVPLARHHRTTNPTLDGGEQRPDWVGLALVIDDEEIVRNSLTLLLSSWGCDVVSAADGDEALSRLAGRRPDIILADYRLRSNRTGIETIAQVQAACQTTIRSIVITGDTAPERIAEAMQSGHRILHKPITPLGLQEALAVE